VRYFLRLSVSPFIHGNCYIKDLGILDKNVRGWRDIIYFESETYN